MIFFVDELRREFTDVGARIMFLYKCSPTYKAIYPPLFGLLGIQSPVINIVRAANATQLNAPLNLSSACWHWLATHLAAADNGKDQFWWGCRGLNNL